MYCSIESIPQTNDVAVQVLSYREHEWPPLIRKQILSLCRPGSETTLEEVCDLNFAIGEVFAQAAASSGVDLNEVDVIASHGQTLWHTPVPLERGAGYAAGERHMSTLQMGESSVLQARTGRWVLGTAPLSNTHSEDLKPCWA